MLQIRWRPFLISLFAPAVLVGGLTALLTVNSMEGYNALRKPPFSSPGWLSVVWTVLFLLMGIASYLIYAGNADPWEKYRALFLYGMQLVFHFLWSLIFFRLQRYSLSVLVLVILFVFILLCIWTFSKISRAAAWLMVLYAVWTAFAGYLSLLSALKNQSLPL